MRIFFWIVTGLLLFCQAFMVKAYALPIVTSLMARMSVLCSPGRQWKGSLPYFGTGLQPRWGILSIRAPDSPFGRANGNS